MNRGIDLRMLSLLTAFMLVSVAFIPAVSAQSEMKNAEDALKKVKMEIVTDKENLKESYATVPLEDGKEQKYLIRQWKTEVDGKEVWKFNVFESSPDGTIARDVLFGRDSYYWWDSSGIHMHFGPIDMGALSGGGGAIMEAFGVWLASVLGITGFAGIAFGGVLAVAVIITYWYYQNSDGSMDVYLSNTTIALIPVYALMPGPQPIVVRLGTSDVILLL